jgi:hypothetical protein
MNFRKISRGVIGSMAEGILNKVINEFSEIERERERYVLRYDHL